MLWLIWHIWILVLLAFAGGIIVGWVLHGMSDEAPSEPALDVPAEPVSQPATLSDTPVEPAPVIRDEAIHDEPVQDGAVHDDLTQISGLGPKTAERLNELGVHSYAQIAAWSEEDISRFDELTQARGRISRADWVGQAKAMSA